MKYVCPSRFHLPSTYDDERWWRRNANDIRLPRDVLPLCPCRVHACFQSEVKHIMLYLNGGHTPKFVYLLANGKLMWSKEDGSDPSPSPCGDYQYFASRSMEGWYLDFESRKEEKNAMGVLFSRVQDKIFASDVKIWRSVCHDQVSQLQHLRGQSCLTTVSDLDLDSAPGDILLIEITF